MADIPLSLRRSPLRRAMPATAEWALLGDAAYVRRIGDGGAPDRLAIADLSSLPRLGFKGAEALAGVARRGFRLEPHPNRAFRQADGGLCAILGPTEALMLCDPASPEDRLSRLAADWRIEDGERAYPVPRRDSHAWFAVKGDAAPEMFSRLCAIDLRPHRFADLDVAQTHVARLNAIVIRADSGGRLLFHLLADSAAAVYLLRCLMDAGEEFDAGLVGLETLWPAG